MDLVIAFAMFVAAVIVALAALGLAAMRWGVDSRPGLLDDYGH